MRKIMLIAFAFATVFAITSCGNTAQEIETTEAETTEVLETEETMENTTEEVEVSE
jgi:hypothetical protein